jgi:hypothetical protein
LTKQRKTVFRLTDDKVGVFEPDTSGCELNGGVYLSEDDDTRIEYNE